MLVNAGKTKPFVHIKVTAAKQLGFKGFHITGIMERPASCVLFKPLPCPYPFATLGEEGVLCKQVLQSLLRVFLNQAPLG